MIADGTVLDGRTRLTIARALGLADVPVRIASLAEERDYLIHWYRSDYSLVDLDQLRDLVQRERDAANPIAERLYRMDADLTLYEMHPALPSLREVWDIEGVVYRMIEVPA